MTTRKIGIFGHAIEVGTFLVLVEETPSFAIQVPRIRCLLPRIDLGKVTQ